MQDSFRRDSRRPSTCASTRIPARRRAPCPREPGPAPRNDTRSVMATPSVTDVEQSESTTAIPLASAKRPASTRWKATAYSLAGAASLLAIWQWRSGYSPTEFDLLPAPLQVLERMGDYTFGNELEGIEAGFVFSNFWETFRKTLLGFAGALVVGVPIGILMGRYRYAKNFFF